MRATLASLFSCVQDGHCPSPAACPLNKVRAGTPVRIKQLRASADTAIRLREMGFCEEQIIKLVAASSNIICLVCNARLAISAQLAETILVEPITQRPAA